jgi:diguanylate cyclase (GGDEF)-like protein
MMSQESVVQLSAEDENEVTVRCVRTLFERARKAALQAPMGTLFIGWIGMGTVSQPLLLGWMLLNTLPDAVTFWLTSRLLKNPPPDEHLRTAHNWQILLRFLQGLSWGAAAVILHIAGSSPLSELTVLSVLISISAVSIVNMSPSLRTLAGFSLSLLGLPLIYYLWLGDAQHLTFVVGLLIVLIIEAQFGWDACRQFSDGMRQLVLNRKISRQLELRNRQLDELNQQLSIVATQDKLTGLYNRHFIVGQLEHQYDLFVRYGNVCSIVLLDVDFFKQVNDRYGHAVGDEVLVAVSRRIEGQLRHGDFLGRYGGEEFMLLLPMTNQEAAMQLAQRIRSALADVPLLDQPVSLTVTASFGVAQLRGGEAIDGWLLRADQALYRAKEHGRNCVME